MANLAMCLSECWKDPTDDCTRDFAAVTWVRCAPARGAVMESFAVSTGAWATIKFEVAI